MIINKFNFGSGLDTRLKDIMLIEGVEFDKVQIVKIPSLELITYCDFETLTLFDIM